MAREQYRIGEWQFDVAGAALGGPEGERRLEDRAARTLALLCRRRGETVGHQEILAEVWNGRAVSPNSVAVVIADLRRSLGEESRDPRHIVTVAKRGYRLNLEPEAKSRTGRRPWRPIAASFAALVLLAGIVLVAQAFAGRGDRLVLHVATVRNDTGDARYESLARALDALVTDRVAQQRGWRVVRAAAAADAGGRSLRLDSRLILWNGEPTLSMSATDQTSGTILWAAMAGGPPDALASHVIEKLNRFGADAPPRLKAATEEKL
jgi:DNA-binding winged helix-turn-helix (wHTH) protein